MSWLIDTDVLSQPAKRRGAFVFGEAAEARRAFFEKRPPVFRGRRVRHHTLSFRHTPPRPA